MTTTAVTNYDEEFAKEAAKQAAAESTFRFGFRNGQIEVDGQPIGTSLLCYILANRCVNTWYLNEYNPEAMESPQCWSVHRKEDEFSAGPNQGCANPQNETCMSCPKNAFGSATNGRGGKACKNVRRIAIIAAGVEVSPGKYDLYDGPMIAECPVYTGKLPVTSGNNFSDYCRSVPRGYNRPVHGVITKMIVKPDKKSQFKVFFETVVAPSDGEMIGEIRKKIGIAEQGIDFGFEVISNEVEQTANATEKF